MSRGLGRRPRFTRSALAALALVGLLGGLARGDDPAKRWRTLETEHFHIVYYFLPEGGGQAALAQRLAVVAEDTHRRLVPILGPGLTLKRKTWVVLTDETDEANGSANVVPYPLIRLFATSPEDRSELNDYDDWLRALFLHEYAHILHLGTIGGPCATAINAILGVGTGTLYAPNQNQPRFIIEGLAVFEESDRTGGGRLRSAIWDMYLRAQTLEGKFQSLAQVSNLPIQFPDANSGYLYGSALIRHLVERFGPAKLRRMLEDYGSTCIPGAISRSLKRATGTTWPELHRELKATLERRYRAQRDAISQRGLTESRVLLPPWRPNNLRAVFLPGGDEVLVFDEDGHSQRALKRIDVATGRSRQELFDARVYSGGAPSVSRDGRYVVMHAGNPYRTYYAFIDIWLLDRQTRELKRLTEGRRASNPGISPDGTRVVYEINDATSRGLELLDLRTGAREVLIPPSGFEQVYTPVFAPDGKAVAFSWWRQGGYRDIWTLDLQTRALTRVTADRALDLEPRYSPDGRWLYFVSDRTQVHNLYAVERATGQIYQATNVVNGVFDPDLSPDGKRVVFSGFRADGYTLEVAELDPTRFWLAQEALLTRPELPTPEMGPPLPARRYNPARTAFPWTIAPFAQPDGYGELIGLRLRGQDAIAHHTWALQLAFGTGRSDDVNFSANYGYSGTWPQFSVGVGHALLRKGGQIVNGVDVGYDEDDWTFGTSIGLPVLRRALGNADLAFSYNLAYARNLSPPPSFDPSDISPRLAQDTRTAGLAVSFVYDDTRRFRYSVSTARGRTISLSASVGTKYLGSQREVYAFTWRWNEYVPMPWKRRGFQDHVLALAYGGGLSGGDGRRGLFFLGGYPPQDLLKSIYDFSRAGSATLRGYGYASQVGEQFHVLNLEYRFPITWIEWGYQHFPIYFRRLHAKAFVDWGGAFQGGLSFDQLKLGVGGELILEFMYAWYFPASLQLGYAYGVDKGGGNQVYFLLNSPF